jgi:hypothetical protein
VEICCPELRFVTLNTGGKVSVRFPHRKMLTVGKWIATGCCQRRSSLSQSTCPREPFPIVTWPGQLADLAPGLRH